MRGNPFLQTIVWRPFLHFQKNLVVVAFGGRETLVREFKLNIFGCHSGDGVSPPASPSQTRPCGPSCCYQRLKIMPRLFATRPLFLVVHRFNNEKTEDIFCIVGGPPLLGFPRHTGAMPWWRSASETASLTVTGRIGINQAITKMAVLWVVAACTEILSRRFRGPCCSHHHF